jgi:hypothetical protein
MISTIWLLLAPAMSICQSNKQHFELPRCSVHSEGIEWGVKITSKRQIRFTVDDTGGDKCTIYSDLDFVVSMLNASGKEVVIRRFSVPDSISGPSAPSYEFPISNAGVVGVKGLALHCKVRFVGGLPGPGEEQSDGSNTDLHTRSVLRKELKKEKASYKEWFGAQADYAEYISESGTTCQSLRAGKEDPKKVDCPTAEQEAEDLKNKRTEQFGEAIVLHKQQ